MRPFWGGFNRLCKVNVNVVTFVVRFYGRGGEIGHVTLVCCRSGTRSDFFFLNSAGAFIIHQKQRHNYVTMAAN